ncbi:MAG: PilC/PilY family type IV pilus protein [Cocleimonas sp.]
MYSRIKKSLLALVILIFSSVSHADDLDILAAQKLVDANILFVMDLSGSMRWCPGPYTADETCSTGPSRLDVLRGAFQDIVADTDFDAINIGLSVFSGGAQSNEGASKAHGITYPVSPIVGTLAQTILNKTGFVHPGVAPNDSYMPVVPAADSATMDSRQYLSLLSADIDLWSAYGSTPIVDALYEAALYFRGEGVEAGKYPPGDVRSAHPSTFTGAGFTIGTTTVSNASCDVSERNVCSQGYNCNASESCTTVANTSYSAIDTGGCTLQTGNTQWCGTNASCGLGTGCTSSIRTYTRFCGTGLPTIDSCMLAHPTWEACETYTDTSTVLNSEGFPVVTETTLVKCKEDRTFYRCDAVDTYSCPSTYQRCTECPDDETITELTGTATYKSPIINECSNNGIILLSDGGPTENTTADLIQAKIGTYAQSCQTAPSSGSDIQVYGRCGPELTKFLSTEDHADGTTSVPDIDGIQTVKTYTVGLSLLDGSDEADYLEELATEGGGAFVNANDRASLTAAFKDALLGIATAKARSFSAPSYSIDTSTLLTNAPFVYIPVFDSSGALWPGNLKKYKLVNGILVDADNTAALDADNALLATARDFWSPDASNDVITSGGAANKINPTTRVVKTDNGTSLIDLNSSIGNASFGLSMTAAEQTVRKPILIKYIRGTNPTDDTPRNHMGDIIHSKPVQLEIAGGRKIIFVGSNEGFLHAINDYSTESDTRNGTEAFAYMPSELLKNINVQYEGIPSTNHTYGVDGLITVWIDERANTNLSQVGNKVLDVAASGEKAYVLFGLRRGGNSYTVLEVTDPDTPRMVWSKSFGSGNSWSQPVVASLKWGTNTTEKPVVIIGGGFNDDATGTEQAGGNNVYVIDLATGAIVWDTSVAFSNSLVTNFTGSALPNAVPARIRAIDTERNNSIDKLYFGDTGGNIWRVDLNAANYDAITTNDNDVNKATLHRIAELGGTGVNDRKFFEEPDVAIFKNGGKLVTSISIGSGDRPNPLSVAVEDKFFVLYDSAVLTLPTDPLITLSSGNIKTLPVSNSDRLATTYKGWQKSLTSSTGEKILSSALTFQGKVLFTSFGVSSTTTTSTTSGGCEAPYPNENKLYVLDLFTGSQDGVFTNPGGEIMTEPRIVFPPGVTCVTGNCKRVPKIGFGKGIIDFPGPLAANGDALLDSSGNAISGGGKSLERVYWIDSEK